MKEDTFKDIINDMRDLAQHIENIPAHILKYGIEFLANRFERLSGATPMDVVREALCPKDAPKIDPVFAKPPLEDFAKFLAVPALGIQFRRYRSANTTILVATWRDDTNSHVYMLRVERDGDSPNCGWRATATNDGHIVFQLRTKNRSNCEHFAFSAMKRYLKRGHRKTYRTIAKAKEGK